MLRLLADENCNGSIVRGLLRRQPDVDVVRVQDVVELSGADDRTVLAWAATEGRVLLTHDQHTVPKYAYERIVAGLPMPGVFVGDTDLPVQQAIEDLLLLVQYRARVGKSGALSALVSGAASRFFRIPLDVPFIFHRCIALFGFQKYLAFLQGSRTINPERGA
jgi:hypothetical protein